MEIVLACLSTVLFFLWINSTLNNFKMIAFYRHMLEHVDSDFEIDQEKRDLGMVDIRPENYDKSIDLRGVPTHRCPCGCNIWNVKTIFDDYEIATYFLDMECVSCGSVATAPTPLDRTGPA